MSNSEFSFIEYEELDGAGIVQFDRPDSMNAFNTGLLQELEHAIVRAEETDGVRAVILTGSNDIFSAGNDFSEEIDLDGSTSRLEAHTGDRRKRPGYIGHYETIFNSPLPIIAAVDGYALASACNLACICDITIATEDAEFGFPEVHMGALPGILVHPYIGVGPKHAKELLFSGRHVDAEEAERIGLINRVVPTDQLWDEAMDEVDYIKLTPSSTVSLSKIMVNDAMRKMGYQAPDGQLDRYLWALSSNSPAAEQFNEIRTEKGMSEAMEWMHTTEKK